MHMLLYVLHWIISTSIQTYFDFYDVRLLDTKPSLAWTYSKKKKKKKTLTHTQWEDKNKHNTTTQSFRTTTKIEKTTHEMLNNRRSNKKTKIWVLIPHYVSHEKREKWQQLVFFFFHFNNVDEHVSTGKLTVRCFISVWTLHVSNKKDKGSK